jgi:hypothetical protein
MAREIVTWCDPCIGTDQRTPGREVAITLGTGKPRVIAVCDAHEAEYVKPLEALLSEFGSPVDGSPKGIAGSDAPRHLLDFQISGTRKGRTPEGERTSQCLWCPLTFASDGSGLLGHIEKVHGLPRSLKDAFGPACPVCGNAYELLGSHVKKSHGCESITDAFLMARENGDPHGVYETVLARAKVIA